MKVACFFDEPARPGDVGLQQLVGDRDDAVGRVDAGDEQRLQLRSILELGNRGVLALGAGNFPAGGQCHAARRVPHRTHVRQVCGRTVVGQDFVPHPKAQLHEQRCQVEVLHHAAHPRVAQHVGMHLRAQILGRLQRVGPASFHGGRRHEEVDVVRVVADVIGHVAWRAIASEVRFVRLRRCWFATEASR